jgi:hypothetical protein
VPASPYFEDYIRRRIAMPVTQYRQALLQYMRGHGSLNQVYGMVEIIPNSATVENALAETWMIAAAYSQFIKHDDVTAQMYRKKIDVQPYGTNEWTMVRYGGV